MSQLSIVLKQRRKELGLTLVQIADQMGVAEATVQRWESGNIKSVRYDKIDKLSSILGVQPSDLMGWGSDDQNKTEPTADDGFSKNKKALIEFAKSVPEDKAARMLQVMQLILASDE